MFKCVLCTVPDSSKKIVHNGKLDFSSTMWWNRYITNVDTNVIDPLKLFCFPRMHEKSQPEKKFVATLGKSGENSDGFLQ